ncbi:MAG: hypothetical protein IH860_02845 [Chloroflexi bacterium]|nr:hypothetical protein [Chloroflexota bacterium]
MAHGPLPLLPTTVIGSYAYPSWQLTAIDEIERGNYGQTDIRETYDDAVNMAILDQERAGIDIVTDGEMRRWHFVQSFYKRMTGIVADPPLRNFPTSVIPLIWRRYPKQPREMDLKRAPVTAAPSAPRVSKPISRSSFDAGSAYAAGGNPVFKG